MDNTVGNPEINPAVIEKIQAAAKHVSREYKLNEEILKLVGINFPVRRYRIEYEGNGGLVNVAIEYNPAVSFRDGE